MDEELEFLFGDPPRMKALMHLTKPSEYSTKIHTWRYTAVIKWVIAIWHVGYMVCIYIYMVYIYIWCVYIYGMYIYIYMYIYGVYIIYNIFILYWDILYIIWIIYRSEATFYLGCTSTYSTCRWTDSILDSSSITKYELRLVLESLKAKHQPTSNINWDYNSWLKHISHPSSSCVVIFQAIPCTLL